MILIEVIIVRIQTAIFTVILLRCGLLLFIDPQNRTRFLQKFPYTGYYEITPLNKLLLSISGFCSFFIFPWVLWYVCKTIFSGATTHLFIAIRLFPRFQLPSFWICDNCFRGIFTSHLHMNSLHWLKIILQKRFLIVICLVPAQKLVIIQNLRYSDIMRVILTESILWFIIYPLVTMSILQKIPLGRNCMILWW